MNLCSIKNGYHKSDYMKTSISLSSSVRAGLRSLYREKSVRVKFVNLSGREVQLYWINYIGECEKAFKITDGKLL